MRALWLLLAACDYTAGQAVELPDGNPTPIGRSCHVHDSSLRLCLDFEDPTLTPVVRDGSGLLHDARASQVGSMMRLAEHAAVVGPASQIVVPEAPDLDLGPAITLELWAQPSAMTGSAIVNNGQYELGFEDPSVFCTYGDAVIVADVPPFATGSWHHIACTYDYVTLKIYVDGSAVGCLAAPNGATANLHDGTALGEGYTGGLDNVHVYARTLGANEICALGGGGAMCSGCPVK